MSIRSGCAECEGGYAWCGEGEASSPSGSSCASGSPAHASPISASSCRMRLAHAADSSSLVKLSA
eukprot:CAMPEP_0180080790 /NCGR_PEP_ID=MMETSP0985-20121206/17748_1 /TAXON_ID=483367 /ORGANISM="non described non described, Strain CCMP 2436" /LENGTH=64 /DNA_ID=CAMNT_0022013873 /DNA_START=247 /DNA_END=438 /DNA_ORIENTATION=+